jgi:hypothetical protein
MIRSLQRDIRYTRNKNILERKDSILIGSWILIRMEYLVKFQFLVRFCVDLFIILICINDDSKIFRNTSFISWYINIIYSKMVSEITNIFIYNLTAVFSKLNAHWLLWENQAANLNSAHHQNFAAAPSKLPDLITFDRLDCRRSNSA